MLYHTADIAVKENQVSLIILRIESNIEAQTQIKPSERDKLLAKTRVQRKEFQKKIKLLWMLMLIFYNKNSIK